MVHKNKVLLLLSGGIDSPVAGRILLDNDFELIALHFSLEPFTDDSAKRKSIEIAKKLGIKKIIAIKCGNEHAKIVESCKHKYYYIISRRMMLRIAEIIAKQENCRFICTGDNLGQVGSQTLENLDVISRAIEMQILRPLLTNDKLETIKLAKEFGTYEISIGPEMCSVLGPKHPATKSRIDVIEEEEKKVDMQELINEQLKNAEVIDI